jgi:small-conductance mechanosensitive channel
MREGVGAKVTEFSDQDLRLVLNRALRNVGIAILLFTPILWIAWGWRSMVMFLVGGAIAATGILEWRQLMTAVLARLNKQDTHPLETDTSGSGVRETHTPSAPPRPMGPVVFWFCFRLVIAAGVLYVSLRSLDGKVAALLIGLALALVALFIEAIRLFRAWSA